jgi:UDP-N-acetylmuramate dehydrogenase
VRELLNVPLAAYTTLGLGGPARRLVEAATDEDVICAVQAIDADGEPLLVLGGGSNLVVADEGFAGVVVRVCPRGIDVHDGGRDDDSGGGSVDVVVRAGEDWDELVARTVAVGLSGMECLSGIPGLVGAAPMQNIGAYGQEVSQTITGVRAYDRQLRNEVTLPAAKCGFGYRHSVFKTTARYVVLAVSFALERSALSQPVRYTELARALGVRPSDRAPLADVRATVLDLRRGKGMVLDPADADTRSAGSFFTNPVLDPAALRALEERVAQRLGPQAAFPRFPERDGSVKTSAAWLIQHAGYGRGYGAGRARISTKHTLALTNRGGATTAELLTLAREVRDGVRAAFGVELVNEPVLVGTAL